MGFSVQSKPGVGGVCVEFLAASAGVLGRASALERAAGGLGTGVAVAGEGSDRRPTVEGASRGDAR